MDNNLGNIYGSLWKERELVIALHYYFLYRDMPCSKDSSFVQELARLLGRTPASVAMRMGNFANLDTRPDVSRRGLANGGPLCRNVFLEWACKRESLRPCAEVYIRELNQPGTLDFLGPNETAVPKAFQKYELLDLLGRGGSGTVYSCVDPEIDSAYALKISNPDNRFDKEALHRFRREVRILREVRHKHVIRLYEDNLEADESSPAFVMDLAECSLARFLDRIQEEGAGHRPLMPTAEAAALLRSMASAVEMLHHHEPKILHRDINPNNILLLRDNHWVLADFGLAKFVRSAATSATFVTKPSRGPGTGYYTAPEQYRDFTTTDERTDVFALGVLLWELFASAAPPPNPLRPALPKGLKKVYLKAVEYEPPRRYQSVSEMMADFETAMESSSQKFQRAGTGRLMATNQ
jgi:serine/threonine protein kinase